MQKENITQDNRHSYLVIKSAQLRPYIANLTRKQRNACGSFRPAASSPRMQRTRPQGLRRLDSGNKTARPPQVHHPYEELGIPFGCIGTVLTLSLCWIRAVSREIHAATRKLKNRSPFFLAEWRRPFGGDSSNRQDKKFERACEHGHLPLGVPQPALIPFICYKMYVYEVSIC